MQNKHLFYIYLGMIAAIGMLFFLMPVKAHDGHHGLGTTRFMPGMKPSSSRGREYRAATIKIAGRRRRA